MNTIKIFLASSAELKDDRLALENFIGRKNKLLNKENTFLHLDIWENFIDAVSQTRLQDEYNKKIQEADIFIMLFFTKVGMYTSEEFDKALEQFKNINKPLIYTYFKNAHIKFNDLKREDANSVWDFQDKLKRLGHFKTDYENEAELKGHFSEQLEMLFAEGILQKGKSVEPANQVSKCLSAGQPAVTADFLGRETELADIKAKLKATGLLLINAEGGMGKTTLAAKYLNDNINHYKHYAWFFCENGIFEEIKTLAPKLAVDLTKYGEKEEGKLLLDLKTAMENLGKDCLLILDNANNEDLVAAFQNHFGGLHWHVLLTSRCQHVLGKNEYTLSHLKPEDAKTLFKTYHNEDNTEFETLLDKFLNAVDYNTLMIELFSKNVHELAVVGESFANAMSSFEQKGLFLGERSFEIETKYTGNVHKEVATTDQILHALYDLTKLEEADGKLLVNLALLPAESHAVTLLIEALTPENKFAFAQQLKNLAQKGWLNTDKKTYRMSPVVQQIILAKNQNSLHEDAEVLISNLNYKLDNDGMYTLINVKNYAAAQPFAELAKSVTALWDDETFEKALLLLRLSDYYKNIGNYKAALIRLNASATIFEKVNKQNYTVCLERLGNIYMRQGNLTKALHFLEQNLRLTKESFKVDPHNEIFKNTLATSYRKVGDIHKTRGNLKKALQFFKQSNTLCEELFDVNPHSESIKDSLAISYQRIGDIYKTQGNLNKALQFFIRYNDMCKELLQINTNSESTKDSLAISYDKLGDIYNRQGDLKKALQFFKQSNELYIELFEINPLSEWIKDGLANSYQRLGNIYKFNGDLKKALQFFKQSNELYIELFEINPDSESIKSSLATSYLQLGNIHKTQGDHKKALQFFIRYNQLCKELFEINPDSESIKSSLAASYQQLGDIHKIQGEHKKALQLFIRYNHLCKELLETNPDSESIKSSLAISHICLSDLYELDENFKKALNLVKRCNNLYKELYKQNNSIYWHSGIATCYVKLGSLYFKMKQTEKTKSYLQQANVILKQLNETAPEIVQFQKMLLLVQQAMAILQ